MDYLRSLKKPGKMEPSQFLLKLGTANRMATQLPDAPDFEHGFTELQLKRVFLAAMPRAWQENFENANLTVHNTTVQDIRTYMDKQSAKDLFVPRNKSKDNNDRGESNDRNKQNRNNGNNNRNNRHGNNSHNNNRGNQRTGGTNQPNQGNSNNRNNQRNSNRIQNSDPCPLPGHGNRMWGLTD